MNFKMETNENTAAKEKVIFTKKDQLTLLEAFFKYGYQELPSNLLPNMSIETFQTAMKTTLKKLETEYKHRPSIIHWLRCGLYPRGSCIPLALLFIEWYEQHPSNLETGGYNFREIYHFLYKLTMNETPPSLSYNSTKVLYAALSEILEKICPNAEHDILQYFRETYQYSRPINRRKYPGKRTSVNSSTVDDWEI